LSNRRRRVATGTLKRVTARKLGHLQKILCVLQAAPAIHQQVEGHDPQPRVARINGESDAADYSQESNNGGDEQAPGSSQNKPKQRTQYLPAVQRVDGKDVEDQQADIDIKNGANQLVNIRHADRPSRGA